MNRMIFGEADSVRNEDEEEKVDPISKYNNIPGK